jgi:hypothetical protein
MSTKIYDAYRFTDAPADLMQHLWEYRNKWREHQARRLAKQDGIQSLSGAIEWLRNPTPHAPVEGSVVVYFYGTDTLVQTFGIDASCPEFLDGRFVDFHYQNQSDPWYEYEIDDGKLRASARPKLKAEYEERRRIWDAVFTESRCSPAQAGMTFEFITGDVDYHRIATRARDIRMRGLE